MAPPIVIDEPGRVFEVGNVGYIVASKTERGVWWLVQGDECSCHAGRAGMEVCWHRAQVAAFCKAIDEKLRRPRAPQVPVKFFVD